MQGLTQYRYVQWFKPASLNVWRGFYTTGPAGGHAYSRVIFCSDDLFCPAVTSAITLSIVQSSVEFFHNRSKLIEPRGVLSTKDPTGMCRQHG